MLLFLRWTADESSAYTFLGESDTNSPSPQGSKAWLGWAGNPKQEPGSRCARHFLRLRSPPGHLPLKKPEKTVRGERPARIVDLRPSCLSCREFQTAGDVEKNVAALRKHTNTTI